MTIFASSNHPSASIRREVDAPICRNHHIVDVMIEERAGRLQDHPVVWHALRQILNPFLKYQEAIRIADAVADLSGRQAFEHVSRRLQLKTEVAGLEHVPETGFVFVVANHPTGIADGIAVYDGLSPVRPDLCFMANRDAIRVAEGLGDIIIPVDWRKAFRTMTKTRETVKALSQAAKQQRAVVIFPSGRLAYMTLRGLRERPWLSTTITLARRYQAPILPLHIGSRNSWLYYALAQVCDELRDITVFNELLNKRNKRIPMTFGPLIDADDLDQDPDLATKQLQYLVEHQLKT